jgi:hypothetical protein
LSTGFYYGRYGMSSNSSTLVFPVDSDGIQSSDLPVRINNQFTTRDIVQGYYLNDLWRWSPEFAINMGLRLDSISGFTNATQLDPTLNLIWNPSEDTTVHAGLAHYMNTPAFQAFSPAAQASFNGTTNAAVPGRVNPFAQQDNIYDIGLVHKFDPHLTLSLDNYYETNRYYGDEGQFGVVPIFVNLNYDHGYTWGTELSLRYVNNTPDTRFSSYLNLNLGKSFQYGVTSGQFHFTQQELDSITRNGFTLDHAPLVQVTSGLSYYTKPWTFSLQFLYSSGYQTGITSDGQLPVIIQTDLGVQRDFEIEGFGRVSNRLTVLNIFDRVNLIRPAGGIGVFQAAYAPRITIYDTLSFPFQW